MFHGEVNKPASSAAGDELGDKIRRPARGLAGRNAGSGENLWCSYDAGLV